MGLRNGLSVSTGRVLIESTRQATPNPGVSVPEHSHAVEFGLSWAGLAPQAELLAVRYRLLMSN